MANLPQKYPTPVSWANCSSSFRFQVKVFFLFCGFSNFFHLYPPFSLPFFSFKILFIFREGKGGRKRGRKTSMCGCLLHALNWGPDLQPRHVPPLGIEPATLWFAGQHSIHWATPARATFIYLFYYVLLTMLLQLSYFPLFIPLHPAHPLPPAFPPFSSCPWVIHISTLASPLPILFLLSPCLFSTYHLCYLFSCLLYTSDAADDLSVV